MKIYLAMFAGEEQEETLTKAGCRRRLLSFHQLKKAGVREDYLRDMKRKGIGSYKGEKISKAPSMKLKDFYRAKIPH